MIRLLLSCSLVKIQNPHKIFVPLLIILLTVQVISEYFYLEVERQTNSSTDNWAQITKTANAHRKGYRTYRRHKFAVLIQGISAPVINENDQMGPKIIAEKITENNSKLHQKVMNEKREQSKPKLILFGSKWWFDHYPFLNETQKICPKCIFTEDTQLFNISDAVIFHGMTLPRIPPSDKRPPDQIWIWFQLEAPDKRWDRNKFSENYIDVINWTMTYRSDSDIPMPYGEVISNDKMSRPNFNETWAFIPSDVPGQNITKLYDEAVLTIPTIQELKDRKMVAWIASNCVSPSRREKIVRALRKHLVVDGYGYCGRLTCQFERPDRTASGNLGIDCRREISNKYKFYLAFENALCEDYVTEKYFDTLFTQMVPIVYGAANYSAFAPPHSYINVNDFDSVEALAKHLKYLDKNPEEFLKYFEWKKHYWVKNNGYITGYCALCDKLWSKNISHKSYSDLEEWWFHKSDYDRSGEQSCTKYRDFLFKRNLKNKTDNF